MCFLFLLIEKNVFIWYILISFPSLIFSQVFLILSTSTAFFLTLESKQENKETNKNKQNIQTKYEKHIHNTDTHT